jgi:hypothetical protein
MEKKNLIAFIQFKRDGCRYLSNGNLCLSHSRKTSAVASPNHSHTS